MSWENFVYFAVVAALFWIAAAVCAAVCKKRWPAALLASIGTAVLAAFIVSMWVALKRPPMRTMGETRLWYSFFLSLAGLAIYLSWGFKWILGYGSGMAVMFLCINIFKPEIHSAALMPALQSPWFVPHVTVYMFSYAMLGAATLYAIFLWIRESRTAAGQEDLRRCDVLVRIGWAFLSMGMVMGALWAKEAWGDWWSWDPKETWAFATWLGYMVYLHARPRMKDRRWAYLLLIFSFLMLCMCWFGVNYLPSARGLSVHAY